MDNGLPAIGGKSGTTPAFHGTSCDINNISPVAFQIHKQNWFIIYSLSKRTPATPHLDHPHIKRMDFVCYIWMFSFLFAVCSSVDMPTYDVTQEHQTYEERSYAATKWVSTTDRDPENVKGMYLRLFYYMQGANNEGKTLEMTAPMLRHCHDDGNITMLLYIPTSMQDDPPIPTDVAVNITELPASSYMVRQFGGFANDDIWIEERDKLKESVGDNENVTAEEYYAASYSGMHDVTDRRNEVWLSVHNTQQNVE